MAELRQHFNLFVYGTLRRAGSAAEMMHDCEHLGTASVGGVLYDIDRQFPAMVLYGNTRVDGEIWRCPVEKLATLDEFERVDEQLFRRVGVQARLIDEDDTIACWTYVAGPALSRKLTPEQRVAVWTPAER